MGIKNPRFMGNSDEGELDKVELGKPPGNFILVQMGIARMGGGVSTLARGLGHLFREEVPHFKWAICLIVGGSKCLPGWFGALVQ